MRSKIASADAEFARVSSAKSRLSKESEALRAELESAQRANESELAQMRDLSERNKQEEAEIKVRPPRPPRPPREGTRRFATSAGTIILINHLKRWMNPVGDSVRPCINVGAIRKSCSGRSSKRPTRRSARRQGPAPRARCAVAGKRWLSL
jgi:hypothetical protein